MGLVLAEITMDLEDRFGIEIPDSAAYHVETVGDLHSVVMKRLAEPRGSQPVELAPNWTPDEVWMALCGILHRTGDVPYDRITRDTRLREDWGLD